MEDLPPGKGAAAAMLLTANSSRAANATWAQRVRPVQKPSHARDYWQKLCQEKLDELQQRRQCSISTAACHLTRN